MKALAIVLVLCGVASAEPKQEYVSDADAARFLVFFDQIVDTVAQSKDDCGKMAKSLVTLFDQNQKIIDDSNKAKSDGKKLPKAADEHVSAGAKKLVGDLKTCGPDRTVQDAFKRLDRK
jgi:hypothetical protein